MTDSPAGKVDATAQEGQKPDVPQIPKPRLDEEIGKRRELEAHNAELLAKLKAIESKNQDAPDVESMVKKAVAPMERQLEAARMAARNGYSEDAANLVLDLKAKGLSETAALAAAKADKPDLFLRKGDQQFRASQHGALPPQSGANVPTSEEWDFKKEAGKALASGKTHAQVASEVIQEDLRRRMVDGFKRN